MTTEERKKIRRELRQFHGSLKEVALRAGVHYSYVGYVMRGDRNNEDVLTAACEVLAECKKRAAQVEAYRHQLLAEVHPPLLEATLTN
ncbi:helix-turn-helix transcriptional regulator [Arthrospira platensis SPKY1]|nr:helix-turn-helix transcriptional regulator [Arthrospira platensis SPKY1]